MSREEGTFETKTKWVHARDGRGRTENPLQREAENSTRLIKRKVKCEETEMKRVTGLEERGEVKRRKSARYKCGAPTHRRAPGIETWPTIPVYLIRGNRIMNMDVLEMNI
jgi:hypothetical protein